MMVAKNHPLRLLVKKEVNCACAECEDVVEAFIYMVEHECERVIGYVRKFSSESKYETCFEASFRIMLQEWCRRNGVV